MTTGLLEIPGHLLEEIEQLLGSIVPLSSRTLVQKLEQARAEPLHHTSLLHQNACEIRTLPDEALLCGADAVVTVDKSNENTVGDA